MSTMDLALAPSAQPTTHRVPALLRHSLVLAQRSLVKTLRTPEALIDVTLQPVIFLALFTYVFGGAIAGGSQHAYLQFLRSRDPRPDGRARRRGDRRQPQRGRRQGRLRPLPRCWATRWGRTRG